MKGVTWRGSVVAGILSLIGAAVPAPALAGGSSAPSSRNLQLVLPLVTRGAALERFATAVTTPGSPRYGQFRSIPWLAAHFGASVGERSRVVGFLRRSGARAVSVDGTGLFADASMSTDLAQRLFGARLRGVHSARVGSYTSPAGAPRLPGGLRGSVTGVIGLDTRNVLVRPAARPEGSGYEPVSGTPQGCSSGLRAGGFAPNQYLTAYGLSALHGAGLLGQGERVALIEIDGFKAADVRTFAQCFGLPMPRITPYGVGLRHPLTPGIEATLDLELLDAAAPRLRSIDVYESRAIASSAVMALTAPLRNPRAEPQAISVSLGLCEAQNRLALGRSGIAVTERVLEEAAASGISVVAATGDFGSSECVSSSSGQLERRLSVFYPASSPWVTAVGGTNVVLSPGNVITRQVVWNDGSMLPGAATGGGFSELFSRPAFQRGVVGRNRRALPDVALLADTAPGYDVYCSATGSCVNSAHPRPWVTVGGTSAGAPVLAGAVALLDQELRAHSLQNLGSVNQLLYRVGRDPVRAAAVLRDVTRGSNDVSRFVWPDQPALGCCSAARGFDEASGWGGLDLSRLAPIALATQPRIVSVGLSVPAQRPLHAHRISARVSCSGACRVTLIAQLSIRGRRAFTARARPRHIFTASSRTISVPLHHAQLVRLRRAVRRHAGVVARLLGEELDALGHVKARTRPYVLRISG